MGPTHSASQQGVYIAKAPGRTTKYQTSLKQSWASTPAYFVQPLETKKEYNNIGTQELREKLEAADCLDTTNIVGAFKGIASYVQEQWTNSVPVNILFVTDEGKKFITLSR